MDPARDPRKQSRLVRGKEKDRIRLESVALSFWLGDGPPRAKGVKGMKSHWQIDTGQLAWRWSDLVQRVEYNPAWMQETSDPQSGYLPPPPDFASHSPFGGPDWFLPHWAARRGE